MPRNNYDEFLNSGAPLEPTVEPESHGVAEPGGAYRTPDLRKWEEAGSGFSPAVSRTNVLAAPATPLNLCGAPRDDIIIFYLNKVFNKVHIRIHPIDRSPPIDRPATQADTHKYPKQFDGFRFSDDVRKGNGKVLSDLLGPLPAEPNGSQQPVKRERPRRL
jgi:hypothetical protein